MRRPHSLITAALCALSVSAFAAMSHVDKLGQRYEMPAHMQPQPGSRISKSKAVMPKGPRTFNVGHFHKISAVGHVDLILHGRVRHASVVASHSNDWVLNVPQQQSADYHKVMWVKQGTLYINNSGSRVPMQMTVNVPELDALAVRGNVSVTSDHLRSHGLSVFDDSTGNVYLNGMMDVDAITQQGTGALYLSWANSQVLRVFANNRGPVKLSGIAKQLRAKLNNNARFDGQYLRANSIFVRTQQQAQAKVFPVHALDAFAYDFSNIYLFHAPESINRMTMQSGNIFQADWRR